MNIQDFYKYSQFATLAYVNWRRRSGLAPEEAIADANSASRVPGNVDTTIVDTLGEKIFQSTAKGGEGWTVADFHQNDSSGFAATLFTKEGTTEKVLAIRGTEPGANPYLDLLKADLQEIGEYGMAISQAVSLFNYVQQLTAPTAKTDVLRLELNVSLIPPDGDYVTVVGIPPRFISVVRHNDATGLGELIKPGDNATITGHSLGGHLAVIGERLFPGLFDAAVTFNAPGFDPVVGISNLPLGFAITTSGKQLTDEFVNTLFAPYLDTPPAASFESLGASGRLYSMVSEDEIPGNDNSVVSSFITGTPASSQQSITTERDSHMIEPIMDALAIQAQWNKWGQRQLSKDYLNY